MEPPFWFATVPELLPRHLQNGSPVDTTRCKTVAESVAVLHYIPPGCWNALQSIKMPCKVYAHIHNRPTIPLSIPSKASQGKKSSNCLRATSEPGSAMQELFPVAFGWRVFSDLLWFSSWSVASIVRALSSCILSLSEQKCHLHANAIEINWVNSLYLIAVC